MRATLPEKVGAAFGVILIVQVAFGVSMIYTNQGSKNLVQDAMATSTDLQGKIKELTANISRTTTLFSELGTGKARDVFAKLKELEELEVKVIAQSNELAARGFTEGTKVLTAQFETLKANGKAMVLAYIKNETEKGDEHRAAVEGALQRLSEALDHISVIARQLVEGEVGTAFAQLNHGNLLISFGILINFVMSLIIGTIVLRSMRKVISDNSMTLEDNTKELKVTSENLQGGLKTLTTSSQDLVAELATTSSAATQISALAEQLNSRSTDEAREAETMITLAQDGTSKVAALADRIEQVARQNQSVSQNIEEANGQFHAIGALLEHLGKQIKMIHEIVFQTKLLSFNASVEAARAGEHGKGFAVVADEVGELANRSGHVAGEIEKELTNAINQISQIVDSSTVTLKNSMDQNTHAISASREAMDQVQNIFSNISAQTTKTANAIKDFSAATAEQSTGVSEIEAAVRKIESLAHSNDSVNQTISARLQVLEYCISTTTLTVQSLRNTVSRGNRSS